MNILWDMWVESLRHTLEGEAGCRPGSRGSFGMAQDRLFVLAKVAKTIDAPSGFIEEEGRQLCRGRTNSRSLS